MLDYDQRLQEMIDKHNSGLCTRQNRTESDIQGKRGREND